MGNQPISSRQVVKDYHSSVVRENSAHNRINTKKIAGSFDCSLEGLPTVPEGTILGGSEENARVGAGQRIGEPLFDLDSSAGLELFQKACKVSSGGFSIDVDMSNDTTVAGNPDATKVGISNVKINSAPATEIYMESESIDCVISDCVINRLEQNKKKLLFDEVFRLLTSRRTLLSSDILTKNTIPNELRKNLGSYVGCISGAKLVSGTTSWLKEVDFQGTISIFSKKEVKKVIEPLPTSQTARTEKRNIFSQQDSPPHASRAHLKMSGSCKIRRRRSMRLVSTSSSAQPAFMLLNQTSSVMYRNATE